MEEKMPLFVPYIGRKRVLMSKELIIVGIITVPIVDGLARNTLVVKGSKGKKIFFTIKSPTAKTTQRLQVRMWKLEETNEPNVWEIRGTCRLDNNVIWLKFEKIVYNATSKIGTFYFYQRHMEINASCGHVVHLPTDACPLCGERMWSI
jgi:hypothetical protein